MLCLDSWTYKEIEAFRTYKYIYIYIYIYSFMNSNFILEGNSRENKTFLQEIHFMTKYLFETD